jgi:DNA polymerase-3 subunit beta
MVISVNKDDILRAVQIADACIGSKNSNTVLSNCLLNASAESIEVLATDNEIAIRTRIDAASDKEGSFAANGKKMSQIIRELPAGETSLSITSAYQINFKAKDIKGKYTLLGQSSEGYPEIPAFEEENAIEIEQASFKEMFKKVLHAASSEVIKPVFNGIYVLIENGSLTMVATDSRRLSFITRKLDSEAPDKGVIIPLKTVNQVLRVLGTEGNMLFSYNDNQVFFRIDDTEIISRVVDGKFPNYNQVLPKEQAIIATVDTKKLNESLRRAMIFTREPSNRVILHFSNNKLTLDVNTPDLGESKEEIVIESNCKEEISLGINGAFFMDSLKEISTPFVKLGLTDSMKPFQSVLKTTGIIFL